MFLSSIIFVIGLFGCVQSSVLHNELINIPTHQFFSGHHVENIEFESAKLTTPRSSRSTPKIRSILLKVDDKTLELNIQLLESNVIPHRLSMWEVKKDLQAKNNYTYKSVQKSKKLLNGYFYEGVRYNAVLYLYYKGDSPFYDGVVQQNHNFKVITSEPEIRNYAMNRDNSIDLYYRIGVAIPLTLKTLHPKVLLLVESNYFALFGKNYFKAVQYLATLWNAINMKFREISHPVDIKITGIVIAKHIDALGYISFPRNPRDRNAVRNSTLLNNVCRYVKDHFEKAVDFTNFDSVVVMTNVLSNPVVGNKGLACEKNIIYWPDDGQFTSLQIAVHSLMHAFGVNRYDADDTL